MTISFAVNIFFNPLHDHFIAVQAYCQNAKTELKANLSV